MQRRSDYRVKVPLSSTIKARIWRIPEHHFLADKPVASTEVKCQMRDLSVGGMCLTFTARPDMPKVAMDQREHVAVDLLPDPKMLKDG